MMRSYHSYWNRFDQPDPYDGSYDLTDPQSLNRYAYVESDPVNFVDPTGLGGPGDHDNVILTPCVLIDGVDTCQGLHIIPNAFSLSVFHVHGPEQNIFNVWLTPLIQQNPHQGFLQKTPAKKQQDYRDCIKRAGTEFDTAHNAIPNVFHNSLPSRTQVGYMAYGSAFIGLVTLSPSTAGRTFITGYALTFSAKVSLNFVSNQTRRATLFGRFLRARFIDCKKLLN